MKIFFLILQLSLAIYPHPANSVENKLERNDPYDAIKLSRAYYANLPEVTVENAERFERLISALDRANGADTSPVMSKAYGTLLSDMIKGRQVECFMCLYPLVNMSDYPSEIGYLMIQCAAHGRRELSEYIFTTSYGNGHANEFISELRHTLFEYAFPKYAIILVGWIAEIDDGVAERKCRIYSDMLLCLPRIGAISKDTLLSLVQRLVELGAEVSDTAIQKFEQEYRAFEDLLRFLRENQIPDIKEPEA